MMTDLSKTISPKSDQQNADDFLAGPRTITVTKVLLCAEADQPVAIHFEGDNGKPYKACKSMRRVLVSIWGPDGSKYAGRSMTLYRDPSVQFGGMAVGGIRISHMSHIEKAITLALTATRANRKPFTVKPLEMQRREPTPTAAPASAAPATAEVPFDDDPGASPPPPSAAEWAWISVDGTKHPIASGQEWMTRVAGMVAKMPDTETVKSARTRNAPVFKALTMAGELDAVAHISQIISDRIGELEGGK